MSLVIPPGFGNLNIVFTWVGDPEPMLTSIGVTMSDVPTPAEVFDLYADGGWTDLLQIMCSETVQVNALNMEVGQDGGPPIVVDSVPQPADAGTQNANCFPQNNAYLLKKRTALGGRVGRGRMFWPGCAEGNVNSIGVLDTAFRAAVQAVIDGILPALPIGPIDGYVLLHDEDSPTTAPTALSSLLLDQRTATQRRRLRP